MRMQKQEKAAPPMPRRTASDISGKLALLEIVIFVLLVAGCGSSSKASANDPAIAPQVAAVKATRKTLSSTIEIASEFQPYQEIDVYAKVSGYIKKLDVNWGTKVKQGNLLAEL